VDSEDAPGVADTTEAERAMVSLAIFRRALNTGAILVNCQILNVNYSNVEELEQLTDERRGLKQPVHDHRSLIRSA